jgi:hypothetical protein
VLIHPLTPHPADRGNPANSNAIMSKPKVVVTRQLISEAQQLLDAEKDQFEIVQWDAETVRNRIHRP